MPHRIHLTLQRGDYLINETLENLKSADEMMERRNTLEDELLAWISPPQLSEGTDETTQ
jgi:hypothetical protein